MASQPGCKFQQSLSPENTPVSDTTHIISLQQDAVTPSMADDEFRVPHPDRWDCSLCGNEYLPSEAIRYRIGEGFFCDRRDEEDLNCIHRTFNFGLESELETDWVNSGINTIESLEPFLPFLPDNIVAEYRRVRPYHRIPPHDRIFCPHIIRVETENEGQVQVEEKQCNELLGRRRPFIEGTLHYWEPCPRCSNEVCMQCGRIPGEGVEAVRAGICTRSPDMLAYSALLGSDEAGFSHQICPGCGRVMAQHDGCNEMSCPCGQRFCYLCQHARTGEHDRHWLNMDGCPRYGTANSNDARYDDRTLDLQNFDGHVSNFEELRGQGGGSRFRADATAARAADLDFRVPHRARIHRGTQHNYRQGMLVLSARHLLTMMLNGLDSPDIDHYEESRYVARRMRFGHHGALFRLYLNRLRFNRRENLELPGGNDLYDRLSQWTRRLRYQAGAVPNDADSRMRDWTRFRDIIEDQLNVQWPSSFLVDRQYPVHVRADGIQVRALLEPVRRMVLIFRDHIDRHGSDYFTLAISFALRTEMENLRTQLAQLERYGDTARFRAAGTDQDAAYQIADLFFNRLLEEVQDDQEWYQAEDNMAIYRSFYDWIREILSSIDAETRLIRLPRHHRAMPRLSDDLYDVLMEVYDSIRNIIDEGGAENIAQEHLDALIRLEPRFRGRDGFLDHETGRRPLLPLFFYIWQHLDLIIYANRERHVPTESPTSHRSGPGSQHSSPRSSVTSNNDNTPADDHYYLSQTYIQVLEENLYFRENPRFQHVPPPARLASLRQLLPQLRYIAARLARPGQLNSGGNQGWFDALTESHRQIQTNTAPFENFVDTEIGQRLHRVIHRILPAAEASPEINPAREEDQDRFERRRERFHEAHTLVVGQPDNVYLSALLQRIEQDQQQLWTNRNGEMGVLESRFRQFITYLWDYQGYQAVPEALRSQALTQRMEGRGRDFLEDYDPSDTPVGDLQRDFPHLFGIWRRWFGDHEMPDADAAEQGDDNARADARTSAPANPRF